MVLTVYYNSSGFLMIKHAQGEKINLTMSKCNFELGITGNYKALQMKGQEAMGRR